MNKLEQEIEEKSNNWVFEENGHKWSNNDNTAGDNNASFRAGAQFILDKKLSAKMLVWFMNLNSEELSDLVMKTLNPDSPEESANNITNYWINNVYGL